MLPISDFIFWKRLISVLNDFCLLLEIPNESHVDFCSKLSKRPSLRQGGEETSAVSGVDGFDCQANLWYGTTRVFMEVNNLLI